MSNSDLEADNVTAIDRSRTFPKLPLPALRDNYDSLIKSNTDAIRVARVLCIFAMCYVHIHFENINPIVKTFVRDVLGRSSVPLLSVLSGLLMIGYFRKPFRQALRLRFNSLVVPMIAWGSAGWLIAYVLGDIQSFSLNDVLPIWANGYMLHLSFLRDLFFLMLITPVLIWMLKRTPLSLPILVIIGYWIPIEPIMLRPQILPFYAFGLFWGLYDISAPRLLNWLVLALFTAATIAIVFLNFKGYLLDNLLLRPVTAWTFWILALAFARSILLNFFSRIEPAIFLLYLSHASVGRIFMGVYGKTELQMDTIAWLISPAICLGIAIVGKWILSRKQIPLAASIIVSGK